MDRNPALGTTRPHSSQIFPDFREASHQVRPKTKSRPGEESQELGLRSQNCAKHPISGLRSASNYGRPLVCFLISEIIFPPIDPIVSFLISDISAGRRQQKNVMHAILPTAVIANADMSAYYHSVHAPHSVPFEPNCQLCFGCKRYSGRIDCGKRARRKPIDENANEQDAVVAAVATGEPPPSSLDPPPFSSLHRLVQKIHTTGTYDQRA